MADDGKKSTIGQFGEDVAEQFKVDGKTLLSLFDSLSQAANSINNTFGQGRQRIIELRTALADAGPDVLKLGGDLADVSGIISQVADSSRRNVVATTEEIEKLYAANKVLSLGAGELTDAFLDVGMGVETISKTLEESVQYIQSIGGNAKSVMKDVTTNMDQMNRFQFEGGVVGLTKMAAQASMLRFDMSNTFALAEKVLSPEGAIETAAAFQRLGVASGALADPFALMNASINDPSGLQDSLAEVSKQFTYFDEETKSFKINPQGVLTLREMEKEANLTQGSLSKMGLAAAEADKRISAINEAGLTIVKEEDKQYLANIAKMEEGTYKVTLEDGTKKELAELSQPEFDKLIEEQRSGPKTLEEIAKAQMTTSDVMMGDLKAIRNKFVGGIVTANQSQQTAEGVRRAATTLTGEVADSFKTKDVRRETETALGDLGNLITELQNKNISTTDALSNYLTKAGNQLGSIEDKFKKTMTETAERVRANTGDKTAVERLMKEGYDYILGKVDSNATSQQSKSGASVSSLIEGSRAQQIRDEVRTISSGQGGNQKSQVEMMGGIKIDINFSGGAADLTMAQKEQITKMFTDKMNSLDMKQYMVGSTTQQNPTKSDSQYNYA
jgi:hypothetical protein